MAEAFDVHFTWTRTLYRDLLRAMPRRGWTAALSWGFLILIVLLGVFWSVAPGLFGIDTPEARVGFTQGAFGAVILCVIAGYLTLLIEARRAAAEAEDRALALGTCDVSVGPDGISLSTQKSGRVALPWSEVTERIDTAGAIVLISRNDDSIPVPHDALPEGIDPETASRRIDTWWKS